MRKDSPVVVMVVAELGQGVVLDGMKKPSTSIHHSWLSIIITYVAISATNTALNSMIDYILKLIHTTLQWQTVNESKHILICLCQGTLYSNDQSN